MWRWGESNPRTIVVCSSIYVCSILISCANKISLQWVFNIQTFVIYSTVVETDRKKVLQFSIPKYITLM